MEIIKQINIFVKIIMRYFFIILLLSLLFSAKAQVGRTDNGWVVEMIEYNGDTIPRIEMAPILIMPKKTYTSKKDKIRFLRLVRKVKKVLPYAKLASQTLIEIESNLDSIDDKRKQKRYIKKIDKALKERYGEELKNLTISEGRILIKLIDRETGNTSYELVDELKGSFSAFMWQSLARLFGENLKEDYDPDGKDKIIEEIILRIEAGQF